MSGITHSKLSGSVPPKIDGDDWDGDHLVGVIEATEQSTPATPASTHSLLYPKSDGRWYSKGDDGIEHGPFSSGGADLSAFRLSSVKDAPGDLALGTYGDEFEYASHAALASAWSVNSIPVMNAAGSAADVHFAGGSGRVMYKSTTGFDATNWEVAFLFSGFVDRGGMFGIGVYDTSGNGTAVSPYSDGNSYSWNITAYAYASTGTSGGVNYTAHSDGTPTWFALKKAGTTYRFRASTDGTTWTTVVASFTGPSAPARIGFGRHYVNGNDATLLVHRFVYGTATLGLG